MANSFSIFLIVLFASLLQLRVCAQEDTNSPRFLEDESKKQNAQNEPAEQQANTDAVQPEQEKRGYVYDNRTYDPDIHTVLIYKSGFQLNPPIITLGSSERIEVRFDDLHEYTRTFSYTVEHCTHDWQSSDLVESEYIDGFFNNYINDYSTAFNTYYVYTHHQFQIPNRDMRFTRSGNYLLKVYSDDNLDDVIFTRRFMIQESLVVVNAKAVAPRNVALRQEGQEIQFSISHGAFDINNPYRDLHVKLLQNQQWSNAITELKPVFVKNNELVYDYDAPATFMAGNEYRPLDLKSFDYSTEYIRTTKRTPEGYKIVLQPDEKRVFRQYRTIDDINGQFLIKNDDGFEDHTESDYAEVFFSLALDAPLMGSDIYIYGGFNGFQCRPENKLTYNADLNLYQGSLALKQGFYNYQYAVLENHREEPDITILEGSFRDAENEYAILVYYRDFSNNYDQLIGVSYVYANRR